MPDDPKQNSETKPKPPLADKVAGIDEKTWLKYQTIAGAVLGAAAGAILVLIRDDGSFLPLNFVIALALVKFLPDYMEKQTGRSLSRARIAMVILMAAAILTYAGYILITKGPAAFTIKK